MKSTEELIASLADNAQPVRSVSGASALLVKWLAASMLYVGVAALFIGLRPDLADKFHAPLFALEIISLAAITVTCGISAVLLSFPDMRQLRWAIFAPVVPLVSFLVILALEFMADNPPAPPPDHGLDCFLCISLLSFIPALFLLYLMRKNASTHTRAAGAVALLAANSLGCIGLRLAEHTDSIMHLVQWHYLPMLGFGMLGIWLGQKFLKW